MVEAEGVSLASHDFVPFRALADLPMAMSAHVVYAALDPHHPATQSSVVIGQVIRGLIGFDGLLMTDDLSMKALDGSFREKAEKAFAAGIDVALHCNGERHEMQGRPGRYADPVRRGFAPGRGRPGPARAARGVRCRRGPFAFRGWSFRPRVRPGLPIRSTRVPP